MLHVVGVRHHSPACARLVERTIAKARPRFVLVEGPAEMNDRMGELALGHELPIALFSYRAEAGRSFGTWTPFCAYSPEWVALRAARDAGATPLFIDLPAWHAAFARVENRFSDRHARASHRMTALADALGLEDTDALWDHLFEQPQSEDALARALGTYFDELRGHDEAEARDAEREAYMAQWIAWAMGEREADGGDVVVVCGGFHAPFLRDAWPLAPRERPAVPAPEEGVRVGSYLVPYSFHRLDSFTGYESGMPSPAFYQEVWERGPEAAAEAMLFRTIRHLRGKQQRVSAADAIAAKTLTEGLRALRGHAAPARCDVLDGLAGALVKDALEAPLPWTRRGTIRPGTDPMLVAMVAAFSGTRAGKLAPGTPRPPLVDDAFAELEAAGIALGPVAAKLTVPLGDDGGLAKSHVLHRLRVLGVPGLTRTRGPSFSRADTDLREEWTVQRSLDADAALIEAAVYGATLEGACVGKLEEAAARAHGLSPLADVLVEAALAGVHALGARLLGEIARACDEEPSFEALGGAVLRLLGLWKHDALLGLSGAPHLAAVLEAAYARGLWLMEGVRGDGGATARETIEAVVALRDLVRDASADLAIDPAHAHAVCARRAVDDGAPAALRGAALGLLWSTGAFASDDLGEREALRALGAASRRETLGDFLAGLFALAREEATRAAGIVAAVDHTLQAMDRPDFLVALPALRHAFGAFPPREKLRLAKRLLAERGHDAADPRVLLRLAVDPAIARRGMELDAEVTARARRFGLVDAQEEP